MKESVIIFYNVQKKIILFNKKYMKKEDLIAYLDEYLRIWDFQDSSKNWLQVDNSKKEIKKIWYGVDASTYIFDKAKKENVDMLLVHHWMFWGKEAVLVWAPYLRAKKLIEDDIALYACHLPLDAHEVVGNNYWMLKDFVDFYDFKDWEYRVEKFWYYEWQYVWCAIRFDNPVLLSDIVSKYTSKIDIENKLYNFGNKEFVSSVCFVSWGWLYPQEAKDKDFDLFITWEWSHSQIMMAKELWQTVLLWWHYETEKIWPTLLANHLKEMFGLEIVYIDEKY